MRNANDYFRYFFFIYIKVDDFELIRWYITTVQSHQYDRPTDESKLNFLLGVTRCAGSEEIIRFLLAQPIYEGPPDLQFLVVLYETDPELHKRLGYTLDDVAYSRGIITWCIGRHGASRLYQQLKDRPVDSIGMIIPPDSPPWIRPDGTFGQHEGVRKSIVKTATFWNQQGLINLFQS